MASLNEMLGLSNAVHFSNSFISQTKLGHSFISFKSETLTLPTNVYIFIFEVKNSFGDVFYVTPFSFVFASFYIESWFLPSCFVFVVSPTIRLSFGGGGPRYSPARLLLQFLSMLVRLILQTYFTFPYRLVPLSYSLF